MDTPAEEAGVRVDFINTLFNEFSSQRQLIDTSAVDPIIDKLQLAADSLDRLVAQGEINVDDIKSNYQSSREGITQYSSADSILGAICQDVAAMTAVALKHDIANTDLAMPVQQMMSQMSNTFNDLGVRNSMQNGAMPERIMEQSLSQVFGNKASLQGDLKNCVGQVVDDVSKKGIESNPVLSKKELSQGKSYGEQAAEKKQANNNLINKYGDFRAPSK